MIKKIKGTYEVEKITEQGIFFTNGAKITDHHVQDWCENVYASWRKGLSDTGFENQKFYEIEIELVEEYGIRVNGYGIPCYNKQNGYYSSKLEIIFTDVDGTAKKYDTKNCKINEWR